MCMQVDRDFPQLQEIVDEQKLAKTLQRHLGKSFATGEMQVEGCRKDRIYYKSGTDCRLLFTAVIRNRLNQEIDEQLFFGRLFRSNSGHTLRDCLNPKKLTSPKFGPSVMYIPEWAMVLWAYPNDPELPGLSHMFKSSNVLAQMKADPVSFNINHPPVSISGKLTKYVPGKRCGYVFRIRQAGSDSPVVNGDCAVYGKAYRGKDGETAYSILKQIGQTEASKQGELLLSQPYSYDPENRIIWQEALRNPSLAKLVEIIPDLPEKGEEIGKRLAAFHDTDLDLPQEMTIDFQVRELRSKFSAIRDAFPEYQILCNKVFQRLIACSSRIEPVPLRPIHGSFKLSHIFAEEKGITFIDFDGANLGDPGYDLGRFMAHVYRMKVNGKIKPDIAEQTVSRFCTAYNRAVCVPLPQERINWFAASHLVCSEAYKIVKRVSPDIVRDLLRIADRLCEGGTVQD